MPPDEPRRSAGRGEDPAVGQFTLLNQTTLARSMTIEIMGYAALPRREAMERALLATVGPLLTF